MKRIYLLFISAAVCIGCEHKELTVPMVQAEEKVPMEISLSTGPATKGLITGSRLPDPSSVGITIRDSYGYYQGSDYTNIEYTSHDESGVQMWESDSPIMLSSMSGTAYAYYPYYSSITDITAIPVIASSSVQIDWLWGAPVSVSKDNRTATIGLRHALAAVKVSFARGTYSGAGRVTAVSFSGSCAATKATLDATDGSLTSISGAGTAIAPTFATKVLSSSSQEVDIIVVPTSDTDGKITITIDGNDYSLEFGDIQLNPGEITQFHLTVNDGELTLSDISVSEWTYTQADTAEIKVSDKVKIVGDIEDVAIYNNVTDGTVTITAVPKTPTTNKEVEPVTYTGTASLSQSSDINTGVRTITITDIESDVTVTFNGTYTYDIVTQWEVTGGTSTQMLYSYFFESSFSKILRIREDDTDIPVGYTHVFSSSGIHTLKYSFTDHSVPGGIFDKCTALCDVKVSEAVTSIGAAAFSETSITHFEFPATVSTFGSGIVEGCKQLKSVVLPDNLTEIHNSMFSDCVSLTVVDIPDGVTRFGDYAFDGCSSIASIIIPAGVTYIGNYCFSDCTNLRHIVSWPVITPNLGGNYRYNFLRVASGGVLAVPAAAKTGSNYSYWVSSNINLGSYGWTLVYMDE